ncbi:hypothetical protein BC830DRAFT_1115079 [Chytriomyces sp. MP71]|nr:hypothetical protein BC830DRAFT_1115079 [Chytriomyces sp. MP71]
MQLQGPPEAPSNIPCILVTGGAGYIGSNTVLEMLSRRDQGPNGLGWEVVVIDNLSNSNTNALLKAEELSGHKILAFHQIDLLDTEAVQNVFRLHPNIWSVIHFASLKSVAESCSNPLLYYEMNPGSTMNLLRSANELKKEGLLFVFSSSACVYGDSLDQLTYDFSAPEAMMGATEDFETKPKSPYGNTKLMIETILQDLCAQHRKVPETAMRAVILRYFNPVGAHSSGYMGENPRQEPSNLVPIVTRVARRIKYNEPTARLKIYGNNWPTPDGSPVRDFVHVTDLARSHLSALEHLARLKAPIENAGEDAWNCVTYNVGCGRGRSVREVIAMVEKVSGVAIPVEVVGRREGDIGIAVSNPKKALVEMQWRTEKCFEDMCSDAWKFEMASFVPKAPLEQRDSEETLANIDDVHMENGEFHELEGAKLKAHLEYKKSDTSLNENTA